MNLLQAAAMFASMEQGLHHAEHAALERAAVIVETEAKAEIGTYQPDAGPFAAWAELQDSTKRDRVAKGFSENEPLLRTGEMRDSVEHTVKMDFGPGGVAHIGSDSLIAVYQELGTVRIPARHFLGGAAFRKEREVQQVLGHGVVAMLGGQRIT